MIKVAIAEENAIVRWALREAFARADDLELVGETGTVEATILMIERAKPDVLVLRALPDHSTYDVVVKLRDLEGAPLVVVLADDIAPSLAARAIAAGAHGFVDNAASPEELVDTIRRVQRGDQVIPPSITARIDAETDDPAHVLTRRELQVMEMVARGVTNREIAHDLQISVKTVDTHRGHILKKLDVRNNAELALLAVRYGYVTP